MAAVVGIHGIGQQFSGGYQLGTVWFDAVRDGLLRAGHRATAEMLVSGDLRVAFFGDLFRPRGAMATQGPPFAAADIASGLEQDLLAAFFEAAVAQDPSLELPDGAMGVSRMMIQIMLARLARTPALARVAQNIFIGDLKQVTAFLANESVKDRVLARLHADIHEDTRLLIGHSLGSVVAYEYLCRYQPPSVELLVTLGSPLGIPNVIFDNLTPPPISGRGAWPGTVAAWVNIADPNDIVAVRKDLAPLFPGRSGQEVSDRCVDNGDQPHAIDRYLNSAQAGEALGNVLALDRRYQSLKIQTASTNRVMCSSRPAAAAHGDAAK